MPSKLRHAEPTIGDKDTPLCTGHPGLTGSEPLSQLLSEKHCTAIGKLGSPVTLAAYLQAGMDW